MDKEGIYVGKGFVVGYGRAKDFGIGGKWNLLLIKMVQDGRKIQ